MTSHESLASVKLRIVRTSLAIIGTALASWECELQLGQRFLDAHIEAPAEPR